MQKAIQQLLKVQDKDQRIDNLTRMVDSVPEEKEKIRNDLQGAEDKLEAAKEGMQSRRIL